MLPVEEGQLRRDTGVQIVLDYVRMREADYHQLAALDQLRRVVREDTYIRGGVCAVAQNIGQ